MSFTPLKLVSSPQFRVTVELLAERLQRENLDGTFRFYFLSDSKSNIQRFSARSREPANDLREKLGKSKHLIENLFLTEAQRRRLRLQTLEFSGFPAFHLWQVGDIYLYRSFDFGQKQDSYTIFMEKRSPVRADFCRCLDNMFIELESRSKITTINWF